MKHDLKAVHAVMFAAIALSTNNAAAGVFDSVYTSFDTGSCRHFRGRDAEDYGSWTCPGLPGLPVRVAAGDQRMFVSFGKPSPDDRAQRETFPTANDVYAGRVEWRRRSGKPFATILRWNVKIAGADEMGSGPTAATARMLVVTRLGPGGTCHIGYVDARANPKANALARRLADGYSSGFRCGTDKPTTLGEISAGIVMPSGD